LISYISNPKQPAVMISSWQVYPISERTLRYPRFPNAHGERYDMPTPWNVAAARVTGVHCAYPLLP
jgi:hypothetical protein